MSNANKRLREGDRIVVIAGNDKGRTGTILSRNDDKIVVQGINVRKKHMRKTQNSPGRIASIEMAINASNAMLCPVEEKGVRTHIVKDDNGVRHVAYRDGDKDVLYRQTNKKSK